MPYIHILNRYCIVQNVITFKYYTNMFLYISIVLISTLFTNLKAHYINTLLFYINTINAYYYFEEEIFLCYNIL